MAFNSSTSRVATKKLIKVVETSVTGRLVIEDENIIDKSQGGVGRVYIQSEDKIGDNTQLAGAVNFSVYYTLMDKSIASGNIQMEFVEKVALGGIENVAVVPTLKSYKIAKESEKSISVGAVVEIRIYGVVMEEVNILSGEESGFYAKTEKVSTSCLQASSVSTFTVSDVVDLPEGKILSLSTHSSVNKITAYSNYALVDGCCVIDVLLSQGEQLRSIQKMVDFAEEVAVLNLEPEAKLNYFVTDKFLSYSTEDVEEKGSKLVVDSGVGVCIWAFSDTEIDVMADVFSDNKELELVYSHFESSSIQPMQAFSDRQTLVIDVDSKKRMDEILSLGTVTNKINEVKLLDGKAQISGVLNLPVMFKNYDSDEVGCVNLAQEFELVAPIEAQDGDYAVEAEVGQRVLSMKNKAGKDISFVVDFDYTLSLVGHSTHQYVSQIEQLQEVSSSASIIVYKPKAGEGVFEMAKALKVSPDVIRLQNPQIEDENLAQIVVFKR